MILEIKQYTIAEYIELLSILSKETLETLLGKLVSEELYECCELVKKEIEKRV